jgi:RNA polymerase sigma factor (sigma-70 family)
MTGRRSEDGRRPPGPDVGVAPSWRHRLEASERDVEDLQRRLAPEVLGALVRRYGHFDLAEDAVQEALLAASRQWPAEGTPDHARGWLITVASRRLVDLLRSDQARREREHSIAHWTISEPAKPEPAEHDLAGSDDTLVLLFMCSHPAISPASQIALTLRAVAGLSTAEVARAFLVSEETMTRRITRAKQTIQDSHLPFRVPSAEQRPERLRAVLHALYLLFNEGYAATSGPSLQRTELSREAIRLTEMLHRLMPEEPEVAGLLALMLLTHARRAARSAPDGTPIPMAAQDRGRWDSEAIAQGVALVTASLARGNPGPYQLQAAIAAVHDQAPDFACTDWHQILELYELLLSFGENPVVRLNHAVALAMVHGPDAGLERVALLEADARLANDHRLQTVKGHLHEMAGALADARESYLAAAQQATSLPQKRYLNGLAAHLQNTARGD